MGKGVEFRQRLIFESFTVPADPDSVEAVVDREIRTQLEERGRLAFMRVFWALRDRGLKVRAADVDHGIDGFIRHCGAVRRVDEFDESTAVFRS